MGLSAALPVPLMPPPAKNCDAAVDVAAGTTSMAVAEVVPNMALKADDEADAVGMAAGSVEVDIGPNMALKADDWLQNRVSERKERKRDKHNSIQCQPNTCAHLHIHT